jgi:hypothetical protein
VLVCAQPEKGPMQGDEGFAVIWRNAQRARSQLLRIWASSLWSSGVSSCRRAAAMARLLTYSLTLLVVAMYGAADSQLHERDQEKRLLDVKLAGIEDDLIRAGTQSPPPAGLSEQALLTTIEKWLSSQFGFSDIQEHPGIEFVPSTKIVSLRLSSLLSDPSAEVAPNDRASSFQYDTVAVYHDPTRTIYLPEGWTGSTAADLSVLVHEVVHHFQNVLGLKYECMQEREKLAYIAQDRWLAQFGHSLESAFHIDAFSLLVKTRCF